MIRHQRIALARHRRRVEWRRGVVIPVRIEFDGQAEFEQLMRARIAADSVRFDPLPDSVIRVSGFWDGE